MERKKYDHLSLQDRQTIYPMLANRASVSKISKVLKRHRSTVYREKSRNRAPLYISGNLDSYEKAKWAQDKAKRRRSDWKRNRRGPLKLAQVRIRIIQLLKTQHSPEKVADELKKSDLGVKVSGKTIRRWINKEAPELKRYLPEKGKKRIKRIVTRRSKRKQCEAAPQKRSIHERDQIVKQRERAGDLEADTIVSKKSKNAIVSVVDRKTRKRWFEPVANLNSETVLWALIKITLEIPPALRRTITFDRGGEFAKWYELEKMFGLTAYFCDPYCPWQKGSVEHSNKEFRRLFPKGTDFASIEQSQVKDAQHLLDNVPMDCLGKISPAQAWQKEMAAAEILLH